MSKLYYYPYSLQSIEKFSSDNTKNELINIIKKSNSNEIVKDISKNMFGSTMHHHYHILYDIRTLLGDKPIIYTEIGTYNGGSASLMMQHPFKTEINCIDPLHLPGRNSLDILEQNIKKFNKNNYIVNIYQKFSTDTTLLQELDNKKFKTDILFIDGDHGHDGVMFDFTNYEKYVNPGGYIVFDDYMDYKDSPNVKLAVDHIVKNIDKTKYIDIGTLDNIQKAYDGLNLTISNEYIIKKL